MALHTNVGLGDFILMEKITMEEFVKNLKLRYSRKIVGCSIPNRHTVMSQRVIGLHNTTVNVRMSSRQRVQYLNLKH